MSLPGGSVSAGMTIQMAQSSLDKDFDFPQMVFDLIVSIESGKETKEEVVKKVRVFLPILYYTIIFFKSTKIGLSWDINCSQLA